MQMAPRRVERSVPGTIRRVRVAHGACIVWRSWWRSTPKLATVSQSGLGAGRTLVRSSVERGMVIMVVLPLSNNAHNSSMIILVRYLDSNTFRKNPNRFRIEVPAFTLLGVGRRAHDGRAG
jgi:hypothetical protein